VEAVDRPMCRNAQEGLRSKLVITAVLHLDNMQNEDAAKRCLTEIPTILDAILCNLNAKQLRYASNVCWFWNASAERIRRKRYYPDTMLQHDPNYDQRSMDSMGCDLCDNLMLTKIEPSVVIVFVSRWREYFSRKLTEDIRGLARYVDGSVPRSCELFMALGSGIIGTRNKVPCEIEECDGISSIMIPRSTEVSVTTFFLTLKALKAAARNTAEFKTSFSSSQISNAKLIILNACANAGVVKKAVKVLVKVFGEEIVIAGGFVQSIYYKKRSYTKGICGLVFSGDLSANMRIHKTKRSPHGAIESDRHAFVENLEDLSASSPHRHFSVMFMYSCVARGYEYFSEHNYQTKLISQVFPGIPVFGMFAFGEIGYNGSQFAKESSSSCHSYSTILCLCRF